MLGPYDMGGVKRPRVTSREDYANEDYEDPSSKKKGKQSKKMKKTRVINGEDRRGRDAVEKEDGNNDEEPYEDDGDDNRVEPMDKKQKKKLHKEKQRNKGDDQEDLDNEVTLGQRLEKLSKTLTKLEAVGTAEVDNVRKGVNNAPTPTADSLVTLLDQALQTNDIALLEQCLACTDSDIIDATTRRLPTHRILRLLRTLVAKFEKRPSRGLLITQWLACILKNHISYLITVPDLSVQLAGLSQMLEQRMQSYSRLSSLAGRLDLLMSQIDSSRQNIDNNNNSMEPLVVYEDN